MGYKLFLDDIRKPWDCVTYMHSRIGPRNPIYLQTGWVVCKNYGCFVATIEDMGLPEFISFDHDLAAEHYIDLVAQGMSKRKARSLKPQEKTGYDCAEWLINYCRNKDLSLPEFAVHSMNPVGVERIFYLLNKYKSIVNDRERV